MLFVRIFTKFVVAISLSLSLYACQQTFQLSHITDTEQLTENEWVLTHLHGAKVKYAKNQQPLSLTFTHEGQRINGFAGCNRFTGHYQFNDDKLTFAPLAMTRRYCNNTAELETNFVNMMANIQLVSRDKNTLLLLSDKKVILAQFSL